MAEKTVATRKESTVLSKEQTRSQKSYIAPPVDIYETPNGLVVMADLPGVAKDSLEVRVENNVLTIQGKTNHVATGNPLYCEYELANFFRQFELSDRVDQSKISADLKCGVLTLNLPKAEEAKPKKIEVRVS
jgi:HSP20 family molecular chaperone IbpA